MPPMSRRCGSGGSRRLGHDRRPGSRWSGPWRQRWRRSPERYGLPWSGRRCRRSIMSHVLLIVGIEAVADLAGRQDLIDDHGAVHDRRWQRSGAAGASRALRTILTPVFSSPSSSPTSLVNSGDRVDVARCRRQQRCLPQRRPGWRSERPRCAASSPSSRLR